MLDPILRVKLGESIEYVRDGILAGLVPFLQGSPAIGKSAAIHAVAAKLNLKVIDARFAGFDPTDMNGFPQIDEKANIARYYPLETFPLDDWELPVNPATGLQYDGWLIFCDELNSAIRAVQAASYKFFLDRMVGQRKLHPKAHICAAGNLDDDGAITEDMSSALISRLMVLECTEDFDFWLQWAQGPDGVRSLITSFLQWKTDCFYTFDNTNPDQPFAAPRSWQDANKLLDVWKGNPVGKLVPLAGKLNIGPAQEFITFASMRLDLPRKDEVLANPKTAPQPGLDNPGALYCLSGALGDWINKDTIGGLMPYILRMPGDFQVITLKNAVRKDKTLLSNPDLAAWINANAKVLI